MSEPRNRDIEEARRYAKFAAQDSAEDYRPLLADLYDHWHRINAEFLGNKVSLPHIRFGPTPARTLSMLSEYTGYGARVEFTINAGLGVDYNLAWLRNPLPSPRTRAFVHGFLEKHLVQQYVWEIEGTREMGYGGFGPRFCDMANRISLQRGWAPVIPRNRGPEDEGSFLARGWPHGPELHADEDCFAPDVTEAAIALAVGPSGRREGRISTQPSLGIWEWVLYKLGCGDAEYLRKMAAGQVDRLHDLRRARYPVLGRFERGQEDEDGAPIAALPECDPAWMMWNGGIVRHVAEGIHRFRTYAELPILADALEEAGCNDMTILRHFRARKKAHDARCWVLNRLLASSAAKPEY